jgi:gas vesicle protein
MNWDFIVGLGVIILIVLIVWAKVSNQTVKDVIIDIKELLSGGVEEVQEKTDEVIMYE